MLSHMTVEQYNTCVEEHSDNLFRFLVKNIKDEERANDFVQDAFEKLWLNREAVEFEKAKSWLFTTGYRIMIDALRRDKKQGDWDENTAAIQLSTDKQYTGLQEVLNQALERLPDIQKQVVLLRDYEGYNYDEIGEITDLSESQVKVYIFRARKKLKAYIGSINTVL